MRIVVFTDWDQWVPRVLTQALLSTLASYPTLHVAAICVRYPPAHARRVLAHAWRLLIGWAKRLCLGDHRYLHREPGPVSLRALARRYGFEVIVVSDANSPQSAQLFRDGLRADVLLSVYWKRFRPAFLALFEQTLNYHDGSVPDYRGLHATAWSVYRGESHSGFTFHRMNERLDRGHVLVEGAVPIAADASVFDVDQAKTRLAASRLQAVAEAILANSPGDPQREPAKYNRVSDVERLTYIEEPTSVTAAELARRVRAFGSVRVRLGDELVWVSGVGAPVAGRGRRRFPCLRLADGDRYLKVSDWRAHRLKRIRRLITSGRTTLERP